MDFSEYYPIHVTGTFNQNLEDYVLECLEKAQILGKPVLFLINSPGGDVSVFVAIAAYIDLFKIPCDGLNMGYANSAASLLLQKCITRYAVSGTIMCAHYGDYTFGNSSIHARLKKEKWPDKTFEEVYRGIIKFVSKRTGLKKKKVMKIFSQERYLTAKQAKKLGFIDHILKKGEIPDGI